MGILTGFELLSQIFCQFPNSGATVFIKNTSIFHAWEQGYNEVLLYH